MLIGNTRISHAKLKLDLSEKRYENYLQTAVFLTELANNGQPHDPRAIGLFRGATGAAEFLFGEEMNFFLREVTVKAGLAREQREHVRAWAADTMPGLALRFKPYMMLADR